MTEQEQRLLEQWTMQIAELEATGQFTEAAKKQQQLDDLEKAVRGVNCQGCEE